tara:strand:+ start:1278 stop:2504 length:1227 start_codon:yes stop_codon:yes gene_type:complete
MKKYTSTNKCRISGNNTKKILNLGIQPLANSLKKTKKNKELKVRLSISYCAESSLLQLDQTVNKNILFDKYVWVTGTGKMTREYADIFFKRINRLNKLEKSDLILEIASNDGTFLKPFINSGFNNVLGVDPAKNIAKIANKNGIKTINDYWNTNFAKKLVRRHGPAKFIFARNVIPHVSNLQDVIKGIKYSLNTKGIGAIEFHDASHIQKKLQYDSIYHEHLCYFSIKSISYLLKKYDLYPFEIFNSPINSGNRLIIFSNKPYIISKRLKKLIEDEKENKVNTLNSWINFANKAKEHKLQFINLLKQNRNLVVVGFGSSARSQTLLNYCNIDNSLISAIIDNNKLKQGFYTPGTNIPIVNINSGLKLKPNIIVILAWNFKNEIIQLCRSKGFKGKFILPLPNKPKVIS